MSENVIAREEQPDHESLGNNRKETLFSQSLGEWLIRNEKIDQRGIDRAMRLHAAGSGRFDQALVKLGLVNEADMAAALAELLGIPLLEQDDYPISSILNKEMNLHFFHENQILPIADFPDHLEVAVSDPLDSAYFLDALRLRFGKPVHPRIGVPVLINEALRRIYGEDNAKNEEEYALKDEWSEDDLEHLKDQASDGPVVKLVDRLIETAVETKASDIHVEPFEDSLRIRFRLDGLLKSEETFPKNYAPTVISRLKIMSKLDFAERRLPQDGRMRMAVSGNMVDFRVSTTPTVYGESVVLRILDKSSVVLDLDTLGFAGDTLREFRKILHQPHGILLVTGPTGSGKTTTLYGALAELNTPERKLLTVEDPVEYELKGVNQVEVKIQIGLTFAKVLRSFLRQDPDIIMVGEIRDLESAQIAVESALTGHLVLSTLHTNSAAATVTRFLEMGIRGYLLTSTLVGVLAQRLVRRICDGCKISYTIPMSDAVELGFLPLDSKMMTLFKGKGCKRCQDTGYKGRLNITELLIPSDAIQRIILEKGSASEIEKIAIQDGMRTIYEDGLRKALAGETTIAEVLRVAHKS
ncbi:MAG: Flp pilus assembly complex ATPase component TadA [Magnetococcales bacterium]|nr:Flp pilus assembly complex ATPase component TadA [Magnetococcales bacterium]